MSGHIRRRGANSWELKFDVGVDPLTGKRKIRYHSFKGTKRDANTELVRLIAQHAAGQSVDPAKTTVAEFLARWDDWASTHLSPKTVERHHIAIRYHIVPHIGALAVQKLRPVHLVELYRKLGQSGGRDGRPLAPGSIIYVHGLLHRVLGHAMVWGVVTQNAAAVVRPPRAPDSEITILNQEQIGAVLRHLNGRTLRPIVSFLIGTGCRRGEVLALRWQDVDLEKAIVRIAHSVEQTKGELRIKAPKTKAGKRSVTISPWLVAELRAHHARQQEQRLKLGMGRASTDSLVFARWDGKMRAPNWLSKKFAQAMATLGIDCKLHGLRHTHVSQLIAAGLDVLTISRRIGHASPAITLNVYGHLFANTDGRAAEIMEVAFIRSQRDNGD
jgi:integrase